MHLSNLFRQNKRALGLVIGLGFLSNTSFKMFALFLVIYLHNHLGVSFIRALQLNMLILFFLVVFLPIMGKVVCHFGGRPVALFGAWGFLIFSFPLVALLHNPSLIAKIIALACFCLLWSTYSAPLPAIFCDIFPQFVYQPTRAKYLFAFTGRQP